MYRRLAALVVGVAGLMACGRDSRPPMTDLALRAPRAPTAGDGAGTAARPDAAHGDVSGLAAADTAVTWDDASPIIGDVDGDGVADSAFVGRSSSAVHVGLIRAHQDRVETLPFRVGNSEMAVCAATAILQTESLDYDPSEAHGAIPGFVRSTVRVGLKLDDGDCDPIHLFWNVSTRHLDWWRA